MKNIIILLFLLGCGSLVQDTAPAPIENGQKRLETIVCGKHNVGENGCVFDQGLVTGDLKIYKIFHGTVRIVGLGCDVDRSINYEYSEGDQWLTIDLKTLVGDQILKDCVLSVLQTVKWKNNRRFTFPIKQVSGDIYLGRCPKDVKCSIAFNQVMTFNRSQTLTVNTTGKGTYVLFGCDRELIPPTNFDGRIAISLGGFYPLGSTGGCMYVLAVAGDNFDDYKVYYRVQYYSDRIVPMFEPVTYKKDRKTYFGGDDLSMATSVNGEYQRKPYGSYRDNEAGDFIRFYTSQGRSLVAFVKGGDIVWVK